MIKQTFLVLFVTLSIPLQANNIFRPSGKIATPEAHLNFMTLQQPEAAKRAALWNVSTLAVQIIASVQSGAGTQPGFNFGNVIAGKDIIKFDKFSEAGADGLLLCPRASRGLEAIALGLAILKHNNPGSPGKNTIATDEDYLQLVFGKGGDLHSMATEAEKAFAVYKKSNISFTTNPKEVLTNATAPLVTPEKIVSATVITPTAQTEEVITTTEVSTKLTAAEKVEMISATEETPEAADSEIPTEISLLEEMEEMEGTVEAIEMKVEMVIAELSPEEQEAMIQAVYLKASIEAEKELNRSQQAAKEKARAEEEAQQKELEKELEAIKPVTKHFRKIRWSVTAGATANKLQVSNDQREVATSEKYQLGYSAGLFVGIPIANQLLFESGLLYAAKGSGRDFDYNNSSVSQQFNYIQLPLQLKHIAQNGKLHFFFQGGAYVAMALNGKRIITQRPEGAGEETISENLSFGDAPEDTYRLLDYGLTTGFGIQFRGVEIGLSYDLGLANISNVRTNGLSVKHRGAGVFLGYGF